MGEWIRKGISGEPVIDDAKERTKSLYPFHEMERRARKLWNEEGLFEIRDPMTAERPFYCLNMFPYPSGDLHVGHGRNYILGDVVTRLKRMQGHSVLTPMGWDAFGLPAENAAIEHKIHPATWTRRNIARMKEQLVSWGLAYDWNREIASCDPTYYRWTQWLFLKLYERGLAYRAKGTVNWCPSCNTVLANEQVVDGKCERCGTAVERLRGARLGDRFGVETEKEGAPAGIEAVHPLTGAKIPIWVANYVLMGYGTGAIMAVPAHDQRDFEFAKKYKLPIVEVVRGPDGAFDGRAAYEGEGTLVTSGAFDGLPSPEG